MNNTFTTQCRQRTSSLQSSLGMLPLEEKLLMMGGTVTKVIISAYKNIPLWRNPAPKPGGISHKGDKV